MINLRNSKALTNGHIPQDSAPVHTATDSKFEHPLVLKQTGNWSRAILWILMSVTAFSIVWAYFAKIEEAIPAQGKLEPQGTVKNVQVPVNGVVKAISVKEGQRVKAGDILVSLDPTTAKAQLESLKKIRASLEEEKRFYQAQMGQGDTIFSTPDRIAPQVLSLTKSRAALAEENRLLQSQLDGSTAGVSMTREQRDRVVSESAESESRAAAARLEVSQLERQLLSIAVQLATAEKTLAINERILNDLTQLTQEGGLSRVQYLKQQEDVNIYQSKVQELTQERERIKLAIAQSEAKVVNTRAVDRKDLSTRVSLNLQKIAEIDTQLTKAVVENNKQIAEVDSQISQANQLLKYGDVRSPVDGVVFDLKVSAPGFVATPTEPILKIVPEDALIAKVSITNQDIGFIREGMLVDVRVDSFPFSEFGDVKGTLISIGSDALPPTQIQPQYTFPAKIRLDRQKLLVKGREVPLQSGMSLSANIKVRERTVMSIFTDFFTKTAESMKFVR
jgi:hemolysin D